MMSSQYFRRFSTIANRMWESVVPGHIRTETSRQVARDGTGHSPANRATVELRDRDHFGGRTGEEHFVGGIEVVAVHRQLFHRVSGLAPQVDDGITGDAAEDARVRR